MNAYQRVVIGLALADALVMLLCPPFLNTPMSRGAFASFDGFLPIFAASARHTVHKDLLAMQIMFVGANMLAAWLALQLRDGRTPGANIGLGVALFAAINLALILTFPPYQSYPGLFRGEPATFDGFYFVLGDRTQRPLYRPMLGMACLFIVANALAAWLMLEIVRRRGLAGTPAVEVAQTLEPGELAQIEASVERRYSKVSKVVGMIRGDRRMNDTGPPDGAERRRLKDRRNKPR